MVAFQRSSLRGLLRGLRGLFPWITPSSLILLSKTSLGEDLL